MKFYADLHTHSKYSDGRGTIEENVVSAIQKGLSQIGITDHGPANIGVGVHDSNTYIEIKKEIEFLNEKYDQIEIKTGAEADVVDLDGTIDISPQIADQLDILIVGLHPHVIPKSISGVWSVVGVNQAAGISQSAKRKAVINNTKALIETINRYDVDIISHPGLGMPVDYSELADACLHCKTMLEINTGHKYDKQELVKTAAQKGVEFVVNSDAHFPATVGELDEGAALLDKYNVQVGQVFNAVK